MGEEISFFILTFLSIGISIRKLDDFLIRTTSGAAVSREFTENGLVRDGTPCGKNLICINQTCVSLFPYIDQTKCPMANNVECDGQGVSQSICRICCSLDQI